jgi:hypothetical protein
MAAVAGGVVMYVDQRLPWIAPEPTFDQLMRLRELAQYDADARMNAACSACNDTGIREQVSQVGHFRTVADIDCECSAGRQAA